jgi:hypothetical protein
MLQKIWVMIRRDSHVRIGPLSDLTINLPLKDGMGGRIRARREDFMSKLVVSPLRF